MIFYLLSLLCSCILGALIVLTDFFPAQNLWLPSILAYLSYQNSFLLDFEIERRFFLFFCIAAFIIFSATVSIPLLFSKNNRKLSKIALSFVLIAITLIKTETTFNFKYIISNNLKKSALYENEFIHPVYSPSLQRKNLIVIFLESLENTYSSKKIFNKNLIPHLSGLNGTKIKGYQEILGLDNTSSALIGTFCGLPYIPLLQEIKRNRHSFRFPKNVCLTDILDKAGYQIYFYTAGDIKFASKDIFLKTHHVHQIEDAKSLRRSEKDDGLSMFDGVKDSVLFDAVLNKIKDLKAEENPFAIFILTLNMHEPEGFLEKQCDKKTSPPFKDIVVCSDTQVYNFIDELKKTPVFKDTLIVLVGDHLARKNTLYHLLEKEKNRTIYNNFINAEKEFSNLDRSFTAMDIGPTVLELLDFRLNKGGLGLGRSLLRDEPTLLELYGKEALEKELLKKSKEYNDFLKN